ncbi:MAG: hypothetical protein K1X79_04500 [Oligoflexia bacterium]|nr:hypothetical protein [Oligoflexia bacterium]
MKLDHHRGLCGDPPMGFLEDIQYDQKNGSISFKARISDGSDVHGKMSCDLLTFEGRLTEERLMGTIKCAGSANGRPREELDLPRVKGNQFGDRKYDSVANWEKSREHIRKFRGPRC